jgi:hypothetical protein
MREIIDMILKYPQKIRPFFFVGFRGNDNRFPLSNHRPKSAITISHFNTRCESNLEHPMCDNLTGQQPAGVAHG